MDGFFFKEGFSHTFVKLIISQLNLSEKHIVLDPFVGVGTTCLACREVGIPSVGVEVSPLFQFIADVKIQDYNVALLRSLRDRILGERFQPQKYVVQPFLKKLFPKPVLEDIFFFKKVLQTVEDEKYRRFFTLALITAAERSSYIYRDGAVVKVVRDKPRIPSLRKALRRVCNMMIKDVEAMPLKNVTAEVRLGDARDLSFLEDETVDAVITSPPYLNKIEYTKCYWPEYELFFSGEGHPSMRSYIGVRPREINYSEYSGDLPPAAFLYFEDMKRALAEINRVLKPGGKGVMVVGGGVFPDKVVETDVETAKIAEDVGLTVDRIVAVSKRAATTRRVVKIGETRESIIYFSKR
ncbi:MAG: DNA methyltransferase [Candidatus Caldarchaeum sp.]